MLRDCNIDQNLAIPSSFLRSDFIIEHQKNLLYERYEMGNVVKRWRCGVNLQESGGFGKINW